MSVEHSVDHMEHWIDDLPRENGFLLLSEARRFAHEESLYDAQYSNEPAYLGSGQGALAVARECGGDFSGPALEVGCGTGLLSVGLVSKDAYKMVFLTDPSPAFLRITKKKLDSLGLAGRVQYAVMTGEDVHRLPAGMFSLIVLRSTLHHILDVDAFLTHAGKALRPGGLLLFQEPCMEGYILMGAMAQFLPIVAQQAAQPLSDDALRRIQMFVDTMRFYARRDLDKSQAEDKHLFRVDELMRTAGSAGLDLSFYANRTFDQFVLSPEERLSPERFTPFFRNYLRYCMSFDDALLALFDEHFAPYCAYIDSLTGEGSMPYMHGVFALKKQ